MRRGTNYPNEPDAESGIDTFNATYPIHLGGGWYELSDGNKVQGKENAELSELQLKG